MPSRDQNQCTLGAGAIIFVNGHVPLVKVGYGLAKGQWILPGGLLQQREHPAEAAVREVLEETGLKVKVTGQVSVRHRIRKDASSDVYWVFLAELTHPHENPGLPALTWPEGEIQEARFWPAEAIANSPDVRPYTKLLLDKALQNRKGAHQLLHVSPLIGNDDQAFGIF